MNNDNFDIDGFLDDDKLFKPLTEGLGFHHSLKEKKEVKSELAHKQIVLKEQLESRARDLNLRSPQIKKTDSKISMGELAPFYALEKEESLSSTNIELESNELLVEASLSLRFGAWLIDLVLVTSLVVVTLISIIFIANIPLAYIRENMMDADLLISFVSISLLFYSFYFSFFDKTQYSTPGKRMLDLKVVTIKGETISFGQAFSRVLITLISGITLGLGSIIKVQDKLTDTLVVRR